MQWQCVGGIDVDGGDIDCISGGGVCRNIDGGYGDDDRDSIVSNDSSNNDTSRGIDGVAMPVMMLVTTMVTLVMILMTMVIVWL